MSGAPHLHGVSLAQLAAVHAALAEPFPIRRVLAIEGLEGPVFRRAEAAWQERMAADAVTQAHYQAERATAEDRLMRIVSPLHEDVEAWAMFLAAYHAHPAEILRATELGRNDVSRLQRFWARQMDEDEALKAQISEVMGRKRGGLPEISAGPRVLRPSPDARAEVRPAPAPTPPTPDPGTPAAPPPAAEPVPAPSVVVPSFLQSHELGMALPHDLFDQAPPPPAPPAVEPPRRLGTMAIPAFEAAPPDPLHFSHQPSAEFVEYLTSPREALPPAPDAGGTFVAPGIAPSRDIPFPHAAPQPTRPPWDAPPQPTRPPAWDAPPQPTRPPSPDAAVGGFDVRQYASLCAELAAYPERTAAILSRYGLPDEAARKHLGELWSQRLAADAATRRVWMELTTQYRDWLSRQRR